MFDWANQQPKALIVSLIHSPSKIYNFALLFDARLAVIFWPPMLFYRKEVPQHYCTHGDRVNVVEGVVWAGGNYAQKYQGNFPGVLGQ